MEPCKFEERIITMSEDVKVLVSEFKAMNDSLRDTKKGYEKHEDESKEYRNKINIIWSTLHTLKYAVVLIFGSGLLWRLIEFLTRK